MFEIIIERTMIMDAMAFEKGFFPSANGRDRVTYYCYTPKNARAVIQLSHGMCEYVRRYEQHAAYFCSQGIAFCGNDHLGHGLTSPGADELGYTDSPEYLIEDLHTMTGLIRRKLPGVPLILLGHSMGSFIARLYLTKYGKETDGAIISGTAGPGNPTAIAKLLTKISIAAHGDHYRDNFIKSLSTGSYEKHFRGESSSAWITRDTDVQEKYLADSLCNFTFTLNGYYNLFDMLGKVSSKKWAATVRKDLPILMISGTDDPVGGYGKGVRKVYERLCDAGVKDITLRLWDGARHELLNESAVRDEVYGCIVNWIGEHFIYDAERT